MTRSPWLDVPLEDYEGHMRAPAVAQLDALSTVFSAALQACRPASVAILGIAGGNGLDVIDRSVTTRVVGVDVNPAYLQETKRRFASMSGLELHCIDLAHDSLEIAAVDLVHAALLFEHAGTGRCLENSLALVAPGGCLSVVLQLPSEADHEIGSTAFESIKRLGSEFSLIDPAAFVERLERQDWRVERESTHALASGKAFWAALLRRGRHCELCIVNCAL